MKFQLKETTLTDGSLVHDVDLFANGETHCGSVTSKPMCIFSCTSKKSALEFFQELHRLVEKHTVEILEEIK